MSKLLLSILAGMTLTAVAVSFVVGCVCIGIYVAEKTRLGDAAYFVVTPTLLIGIPLGVILNYTG